MVKSHKIVCYNVENLFDTLDDPYTDDNEFLPDSRKEWNNEKYATKLDRIQEVLLSIDKSGPLLIGLVEIENEQVINDLLDHKNLVDINYDFMHFDSPDRRGIDVTLIYNASLFTMLSNDVIPVHLGGEKNTRDILYVKGIIQGDNSPVHVYVNHWPSRREGTQETEFKRIIAAETLKRHMDKLRSEDAEARILVMGDFNDEPDNSSIVKALKATTHHNIDADELFNLSGYLNKAEKGTYNYHGDWLMMDQMMVSKQLLLKNKGEFYLKQKGLKLFKNEMLFKDKWAINKTRLRPTFSGDRYQSGYSDHLPIFIEIYKQ